MPSSSHAATAGHAPATPAPRRPPRPQMCRLVRQRAASGQRTFGVRFSRRPFARTSSPSADDAPATGSLINAAAVAGVLPLLGTVAA